MISNRPEGNKLLGFYRGKVVKHLRHGKCKIWIPGVYPAEYADQLCADMLPDAQQIADVFAGANAGNGVFSYPNIGATVRCGFWNGDQNYPYYDGVCLAGQNAFGQYATTFDHNNEEKSSRHLITSGNTHIEIFEDGMISAITKSISADQEKVGSNDVSVDWLSGGELCVNPDTNTIYPPISVDSQLVMRRAGELSTSVNDYTNQIDSRLSMSIAGELSASTNDYKNGVFSSYHADITGRIRIDTHSKDISCFTNMTTQGDFLSQAQSAQVTCFVDMNTEGKIEVHVKNSSGHSKITMGADGKMAIDTTDSLDITTTNTASVKSKTITLSGSTQVELTAPTVKISGTTLSITGTTTNITGSSGDCEIAGVSLTGHTHPVIDTYTGGGVTTAPNK